MKLRKLKSDTELTGKRVLIRIDANVPIKNGKVVDGPHGRIARAAVDIDWLSQRGAKVIILSHLGRPDGKRVPAYSLKPVAKRLGGLLKTRVTLSRDLFGPKVVKRISAMKNGDVLLLENLRFDPREETNAPSFAQALASLGDLYVNHGFAVSHREHASVDAIASDLPSFAGPLLANEISILSKLDSHLKQPFVLVMGGLKFETKLPVIERYLPNVDRVLMGGALATTFLVANGLSVGKSVYDVKSVEAIRSLLEHAKEKILLPTDVVVSGSFRKDAKVRVVDVHDVREAEYIVDIGPSTIARYEKEIHEAKTIVWNGPIGYCEIEKFARGTHAIAKAIAQRTGAATTIVGGGDTVPVLEAAHLADKFTLLSTGGGALLEYLAGKKLPGLEVLEL
ncbi:MAG: phosphoglycerate kinase [Patescibacteria group bacterium]